MDHETLKQVILDQHEIIRAARIVNREYTFEKQANYALVGLRRAGKTTLLHQMIQQLLADGIEIERIIYINFEDERLEDFSSADFNDIVLVQSELSTKPGYYFFDEIQNIAGWEKFARRMADAKEHICITGSNACMLSSEIASTLGGRYVIKHISPYRFREYLSANKLSFDDSSLIASKSSGRILSAFNTYRSYGGLPETLLFQNKREYIDSVYQKVLLNDIVARNNIRNVKILRVLLKKIAETVKNEVSYNTLHNTMKALGYKISIDTIINYIDYSEQAFLLFHLDNMVAPFVEREGSPKYYFGDNGLLGLFVDKSNSALLENLIALALWDRYEEGLSYLKSSKTGIDVDFVIPEKGLAVQAAWSISGQARGREVENLAALAHADERFKRFIVVTHNELETIEYDGVKVEAIPAYRFLVQEV